MKTTKFICILVLFFFTGCSFNQDIYLPETKTDKTENIKEMSNPKKTQKEPLREKSWDWSGYYYGVLPCASCSGIETWLYLNHFNDKTTYELVENYLDENEGVFKSSGDFFKIPNTSVAKLVGNDENKYIFINKNYVSLLDNPNQSVKDEYTLIKLNTFAGDGEQLLVITDSIEQKKDSVQFNALKNFQFANESGQKSLKAQYKLLCRSNSYQILKAIYYKGDFATGQMTSYKGAPSSNFQGDDDVLKQAQQYYCK